MDQIIFELTEMNIDYKSINILQEKDFCLGIDCGGIDFLFQRKSAECLCGMIFCSTFVG